MRICKHVQCARVRGSSSRGENRPLVHTYAPKAQAIPARICQFVGDSEPLALVHQQCRIVRASAHSKCVLVESALYWSTCIASASAALARSACCSSSSRADSCRAAANWKSSSGAPESPRPRGNSEPAATGGAGWKMLNVMLIRSTGNNENCSDGSYSSIVALVVRVVGVAR